MALSTTLRGLVSKLVRDPPHTNRTMGGAHSAVQQRAALLVHALLLRYSCVVLALLLRCLVLALFLWLFPRHHAPLVSGARTHMWHVRDNRRLVAIKTASARLAKSWRTTRFLEGRREIIIRF